MSRLLLVLALLLSSVTGVSGEPPSVQRVEREHAVELDPAFADVVKRLYEAHEHDSERLPRAAVHEDLDQLEWHLENEHSYLTLTGVDYRAMLDAIRVACCAVDGGALRRDDFAVQLQKAIAQLGDGHGGVRGGDGELPLGFLPFLVAHADGGLVAFRADRTALLDEANPYLIAINGRPVDAWLDAAARLVSDGSTSLVSERSARLLRHVGYLALELDGAVPRELFVELGDAAGQVGVVQRMPLAAAKPRYGEWPRTSSRVLDGGVAYLRLRSMDDEAVSTVRTMMPRFLGRRGLIVDVRGNGGGSRSALRALLPWLMDADETPRVVNIAAYRKAEAFGPDHLANRFLFRPDDSEFDDASADAIRAAIAGFEPEWALPEGKFSAWHGFAISRSHEPAAGRFEGKVVVLLDERCFSATDVFLGAMADAPGVTLVGMPSSGGSGRSNGVRLENSRLRIRLSSMASFRVDGRLYDGRGVEPDVVVPPAPTDFIGRTDAQLDAALELIP